MVSGWILPAIIRWIGNNVSNNKVGIYLNISRGNVINNSTVLNNTDSGIDLWDSVGNTLSNSTASK